MLKCENTEVQVKHPIGYFRGMTPQRKVEALFLRKRGWI